MKRSLLVHFRRCHLCSGISESDGVPIEHCGHCGKPMAPFYFFNDIEVEPLSDVEPRPPLILELAKSERVPLRGFTAYW